MKLAKTRKRGFTLKEMLKKQRESGRFHEFLRTAQDTGFFAFDEVLLTRLDPAERRLVHQIARKVPQLYDFDPLPVQWAFPKKFGPQVESADLTTIDDLDEFSFLRVVGGGAAADVQTRHFLTAVKRHPNAVAYFRAGQPARSPITFLEDGQPVALVMPVLPQGR